MRMKTCIYALIFLVYINVLGCAPSISKFKPEVGQKVNPVGLYVIIGSFGGTIEDSYREELTKRFTRQISASMSPKGYEFVELNDKINLSDVYHSSLVWYINEKKIARMASENGCETAYIIFYYLENLGGWNNMQGSNHFLVNSWLVNAPSGKVIAEDCGYVQSPARCMSQFVREGEDRTSRNTHIRYLDWINQKFEAAGTIKQ